MTFKTDFFALAFGALLVLVTFGDDYFGKFIGIPRIGNLDTILGLRLWPLLDAFYFLATISFFLLYGWAYSGEIRAKPLPVLLFISFLTVLVLMNIDDFATILDQNLNFPGAYWAAMTVIYPVYGAVAFFLFGKVNAEG